MIFELQILGHITLAMLLGGLIGFERELAGKPAGLRTYMLVAGAAACFTGLGEILVESVNIPASLINSDPVRIIEATITGISFLGAGTIIRNKEESGVEGLTTAASLLFASAIGIGVVQQYFVLSIGVTLLILLTLRGVKLIENKFT